MDIVLICGFFIFGALSWLAYWGCRQKIEKLEYQEYLNKKEQKILREESEREIESLQERNQKQVQSLEAQVQSLKAESQSLQRRHQERVEEYEKVIRAFRDEHQRGACEVWFKEIAMMSYRNETEVEIKFILPLVKFLGYHETDIELRVPIDLQMGTQPVRGQADWVLWDRLRDRANPLLVIEAKAPGHALDDGVQAQARSYAFGMNAQVYAITDGQRLRVFRRGIKTDTCVVDCAVTDLQRFWSAICQAMGKAKSTEQEKVCAPD